MHELFFTTPRLPKPAAFVGLILVSMVAAAAPPVAAQTPAGPPKITLTAEKVERILAILPDVVETTSSQQAAMLQGLAPGAAKGMSKADRDKLQGIFAAQGYTMDAFALDMSAMVATYLVLSPVAFENHLPSLDKPEIRAMLESPGISEQEKAMMRRQIGEIQKNKNLVRDNLSMVATDGNKRVVRPFLPHIAAVMAKVEEAGKRAIAAGAGPRATPSPGPRRQP